MFFQHIIFSDISSTKSNHFSNYFTPYFKMSSNLNFSFIPSEFELVFLNNDLMQQQYLFKSLTMRLWLKSEYFTISEAADNILEELYIIEENTAQKNLKESDKEPENSKTQERKEKKFHSCPSLTILPLIQNKTVKKAQSLQRFVNTKKNNYSDISSIVKNINSRSDEKIKRILLNYIETELLKREDKCESIAIIDTLINRNFSCTDRLQLINMNELNKFLCVNSREHFQRLFVERFEESLVEFSSENQIFEEKKCRFLRVFLKDFEGIVKRKHIKNILLRIVMKIADLLFALEQLDHSDKIRNIDNIKKKIGTIILIQDFLNKSSINEESLQKESEEILLNTMKFMEKVRVRKEAGGYDSKIIMKISQKFVEIILQSDHS